MTEIYKYAAATRLRFPTRKGDLTVEQLFDLPLKTQAVGGVDLDTVARTINNQLKTVSEESFVEETASDPKKKALTVALDIVKDVIATKQAENKAARLKQEKAAERKKLLDAIGAKKDQALTAASLEELEKKLTALDE